MLFSAPGVLVAERRVECAHDGGVLHAERVQAARARGVRSILVGGGARTVARAAPQGLVERAKEVASFGVPDHQRS
jgi:riboflavin biosynthesis pyrimidine reductase